MVLEIGPARLRFDLNGTYVRKVFYGLRFILTQHHNDPTCAWEQHRALDGAASLLRHRCGRL